MKIIIFCSIGILLASFTFKKKNIPPGTVKIEENFFMDQTEISNQHWVDYMNWTKKNKGEKSEEYLNSIPDTTVWLDTIINKFNKPYTKHYLIHKAFRGYPVVGVSYEQAVSYCKWRTDRVNEMLYLKKEKINWEDFENNGENYTIPNYIKYRLPTKQEWEMVADLPLSKKGISKSKKSKTAPYNIRRKENIDSTTNQTTTVTTPVFSYFPNELNVYCVKGNVAELVQEKGIVKGGHWNMEEEEFNIKKDYSFTKPNSYTGFRCVADVLIEFN